MALNDVSTLPVLLVDDEPQLLHSVSVVLRSAGMTQILTQSDGREVLPMLAVHEVGVLVLDLTMPHIPGSALLERVAADHPDVPVLVMTATNDLETAVQCMQAGAVDYLLKPVDHRRLVSAVKRALELRAWRAEVLSLSEWLLSDAPHQHEAFAEIVTQNRAMEAIFRYLEAIAPSPQPVLITGETGTGKELITRALHRSAGRSGALVAVNVAGLDDTMFSDTLFGHTRGSFTGPTGPGRPHTRAAGGTLFLDEIGDLTVASQVKLLRLLQDGSFYPLGADRPGQSQARIVVATNCDVAGSVSAGTFRKDLYYRLRTHHVSLPPLRGGWAISPSWSIISWRKPPKPSANRSPSCRAHCSSSSRPTVFLAMCANSEALVFDAVARHQGATLSLHSFKEASWHATASGGPAAGRGLRR